jgi:uncharacterized protein
MAQDNAELMQTATDALNNGDIDTFLGMHSDDVKLHVTGRNAASGDFEGRQGVARAFQQQMQLLDGPPAFETHDALGSDDHAVLLGVQRLTRGGKTLELQTTVVAHIKDGKFTEVWVATNDPYAEDEFYS